MVRNWDPVCRSVGVPSLGPSLPLSPPPCPLPPAGMGRSAASSLFSGVAQSFLCSAKGLAVCSVSAFCRLIFSLLPSHSLSCYLTKAPSDCPQGLWPVLTLSNAAGSSPLRPHLLVAGVGVWGTFLLGVAFRHVICFTFYLLFPSQSGCPPRFKNFPQTCQRKGFLVFGNFLY